MENEIEHEIEFDEEFNERYYEEVVDDYKTEVEGRLYQYLTDNLDMSKPIKDKLLNALDTSFVNLEIEDLPDTYINNWFKVNSRRIFNDMYIGDYLYDLHMDNEMERQHDEMMKESDSE